MEKGKPVDKTDAFSTHYEFYAMAKELFEALKQQQIYVRYFDQPRLSNYLRISIGTREEMEELFAFLEKYLAE